MNYLFLSILILSNTLCFGQNLVRNPSFEQHTSCPDGSNQLSRCSYWSSYCNSPDYFHACAPLAGMATPTAMWGYQEPHSGVAYASLVTIYWDNNYREIIGNSLSSSLIIGKEYNFSFYVNFAFDSLSSGVASNKIGLRFSTSPHSELNPIAINNFAHFYSDSILSDTLEWVQFSGSFVADSAYSYLAIGNFFLDSLTDTIQVGTAPPVYAMYYIDDVSVVPVDTNQTTVGFDQFAADDLLFHVFPNPFTEELNFDFSGDEWYQIRLLDMLGNELYHTSFMNKLTINTGPFVEGIYFYELCNERGERLTGKVRKE